MLTVDFSYFPLQRGERVLDLGCGESRHVISTFLEAEVHSVGVDLSLEDLGTAREKYADFSEAAGGERAVPRSSSDRSTPTECTSASRKVEMTCLRSVGR